MILSVDDWIFSNFIKNPRWRIKCLEAAILDIKSLKTLKSPNLTFFHHISLKNLTGWNLKKREKIKMKAGGHLGFGHYFH